MESAIYRVEFRIKAPDGRNLDDVCGAVVGRHEPAEGGAIVEGSGRVGRGPSMTDAVLDWLSGRAGPGEPAS